MPGRQWAVCVALQTSLGVGATAAETVKPVKWPILAASAQSVDLNLRAAKSLARIDLRDINGRKQYELVCFAGDFNAENSLGDFIYSGDLQCGLGISGAPLDWTLGNRTLLSAEYSAMHSRGTFNPPHMVGLCATCPDYGSTRTFLLRGFRLVLTVSDVEVTPGYSGGVEYTAHNTGESRKQYPVGHVKLTVTVSPEPAVTSEFALPGKYANPGNDPAACAKVLTRQN